ncbi:hypothetical protein ACH5RR_002030 [Cinchona calisaya]|uniref:Uncharacterized protein n=1 Tax=Cinchona calisaya TaxID=153742 RepID=A0ABD3B550_9GENT
MAVIPCGSTWMARCGIQPQIVARFDITNKLSPPSHCFSSKSKALASPSSLFFSQIPMHVLFNSWSYKNSCQKRGARFTIRAEQDYYTVLVVSKNASKSEIKSGKYSLALL